MLSEVSLNRKIAIVTGAGRGIGRAIAIGLANQGVRVVVASLKKSEATAVAEEINQKGGHGHPVAGDLVDLKVIDRIFKETLLTFGDLDILVNAAGINTTKASVDYTEEIWDYEMAVNLKAAFFCSQAATRIMIPKRSGKIVNISSTSGFVASSKPKAAYDTSKGALRQMTVTLGSELAPHGINVNAIAPGTILSDMTRAFLDTEEQKARSLARIPLGRIGDPEDIVGPVIFLCSPAAEYIVGHTLVVDGGWLL